MSFSMLLYRKWAVSVDGRAKEAIVLLKASTKSNQ